MGSLEDRVEILLRGMPLVAKVKEEMNEVRVRMQVLKLEQAALKIRMANLLKKMSFFKTKQKKEARMWDCVGSRDLSSSSCN